MNEVMFVLDERLTRAYGWKKVVLFVKGYNEEDRTMRPDSCWVTRSRESNSILAMQENITIICWQIEHKSSRSRSLESIIGYT